MTKCINYKLATDIVWLVVGIVLLIIGGVILRFALTNNRKYHEIQDYVEQARSNLDCVAGTQFIIAMIAICISIILILYFTINLITCVTFPEKIILDMVQSYLTNI